MANSPLAGLFPLTNPAGTAPQVHYYAMASNYASTIGEGCLLVKASTGLNLATTTVAEGSVVGVAATNWIPGTSPEATIAVFDDPSQEFSIICDTQCATTAALAAAAIIDAVGQVATFTASSNGYNGTYRRGEPKLAFSSIVATQAASLPFQILGDCPQTGDVATSAYYPFKVKIAPNMHFITQQQ